MEQKTIYYLEGRQDIIIDNAHHAPRIGDKVYIDNDADPDATGLYTITDAELVIAIGENGRPSSHNLYVWLDKAES